MKAARKTNAKLNAGVFVSSWLGGLLLQVGEWLIKKLPLVKHIYSAAKQVSAAVNPSNESTASFRECVIVRHPRQGELAFGFITGQTTLAVSLRQWQIPIPLPSRRIRCWYGCKPQWFASCRMKRETKSFSAYTCRPTIFMLATSFCWRKGISSVLISPWERA